MTGNVKFNDNVQVNFGTGGDSRIYHDAVNTYFDNFTGDLKIRNFADDKDIIFESDDGSGGTTTYFFLDGSRADGTYIYTEFPDNSIIGLGNDTDLQMYHNSTNSVIDNYTGDLAFQQKADNKDIVFNCDDGSGGITEYFKLQGSNERLVVAAPNGMKFNDSIQAKFGNGSDLQIYHDGTNSVINNVTGNLQIYNNANDGDIQFISDDGTGGTTTYFQLDGSLELNRFFKSTLYNDNIRASFGTSSDLQLYHSGSSAIMFNSTGNIIFTNYADDSDIIFQSDDGSGGATTYFYLDGSTVRNRFSKTVTLSDSVPLILGDGDDLQIQHDGSNSYINQLGSGNLYINQNVNDGDIIFRSDNGSGGVTEYFRLDGSAVITRVAKSFLFEDNIKSIFGAGSDLQIYHSGTDSFINNDTGDLIIKNFANDKDIIFQSDNGSGGIATYFYLDGSLTTVSPRTVFPDNSVLGFGTGADLQIYHDGTTSNIANYTNNLSIINHFDDGDIKFFSDDGSGGVTEYFRLDGGDENVRFSKNVKFSDSVHAVFGNSADLKIYHDGSNSFVQDTGTGALFLEGNGEVRIRKSATSEIMSKFIADGAVELYYDNVKKLETTNTGIRIAGVSEYADNTAAIAGGLTTGDVYRTGDLLKIVH